jgi:hypothetical protein
MFDPRIGTQILTSIEDDTKTMRVHMDTAHAEIERLRALLLMWHEAFGAECYNNALEKMDEDTCTALGVKR